MFRREIANPRQNPGSAIEPGTGRKKRLEREGKRREREGNG
jgi:hypothetical protein